MTKHLRRSPDLKQQLKQLANRSDVSDAERGWPSKNTKRLALTNGSSTPEIHRTLPHSIEAEQGVLGSMMMDPRDVIGRCVEVITEDYFYIPAHQTIYKVMVELWRESKIGDLVTFTQVLRDRNLLESVGGAAFITSLYRFVPTSANIDYYLDILKDKFISRQLIAFGTEVVRRGFEEQDEVDKLLAEVEGKALMVRPIETGTLHSIHDDVMNAIEALEKLYENKGSITGLPTGFHDLDRMTSGLQPQELTVIAGRPSMGKTSLAMNIADEVAVNHQIPVVIFSLEMSRQQLAQRMLCSRARVNLQRVRDGFLTERDFPAITAAASKIGESGIIIIDQKLYVDGLIAKARRLKHERGIQLIIVDYLQLVNARGFKADHREKEVAYVSASLKGLAKDLNVPVIVVAQLNRQPEARRGGKPRLSDLRESGAIEQDADNIYLLVRPEVYEDDPDSKAGMCGEAELIIAKQRNGPVGEVDLTFLKEFTRFEDRARDIQREML